jgi:hypothetical protein
VVHYRTERITEQQQEQVRTGLKTELDERHRRTEPELAWLPSVSESWTPGAAAWPAAWSMALSPATSPATNTTASPVTLAKSKPYSAPPAPSTSH